MEKKSKYMIIVISFFLYIAFLASAGIILGGDWSIYPKASESYEDDGQDRIEFKEGLQIILTEKKSRTLIGVSENGKLEADLKILGKNNIITIKNTSDDLTAFNIGGKYVRTVTTDPHIPVVADADKAKAWESYETYKYEDYIAIKSVASNKFLSCNHNGNKEINAVGEEMNEWELFSVYIDSPFGYKNLFTGESLKTNMMNIGALNGIYNNQDSITNSTSIGLAMDVFYTWIIRSTKS